MPVLLNNKDDFIKLADKAQRCIIKRTKEGKIKLKLRLKRRLYVYITEDENEANELLKYVKCEKLEL